MKRVIKRYFNSHTSSYTLAFYRIGFGALMCYSIIRFWYKGWINELYIQPKFHFSYYGFEWVKPLGDYTYLIFVLCFISSFLVMIGFRYRFSIVLFFLSFTYIELMDKTTYLNHYYFISILSFLLIFIPCNAIFSVDNLINKRKFVKVPKWNIDVLKLLITIVYLYAGLAKINSDWLFEAMPLKIWLQSKYDLPLIGNNLLQMKWVHYAMSWGGMLYDLSIPFLLMINRTRVIAFLLVIFFHVFTLILFPIGMFPHIMIFSSMIFFSSKFHKKIIDRICSLIILNNKPELISLEFYDSPYKKIKLIIVSVFFLIQLIVPFRYQLYPGELFWHEQGYRFSWRVMLIEKIGYTNFKIFDPETSSSFMVDSSEYLTPVQEKQMSFQPDFILEFSHFLGKKFSSKSKRVEVYADSFVALNGRPSQRFIDPNVNLYDEKESFKNKNWVLPLNDEIKGL
ncbi:MAG: HTTM domain-containing protein [Bacteroidota bacterium]|nr:HTTM domain-containing protein [Bacteroidota bacterium]MEC8221560.1 HTTM domain-containing protein [Bacteroidota bacterium]